MIASKPIEPATSRETYPMVPNASFAPARPRNAPERTIVIAVMRSTEIPAVRAAAAFAPTARIWKPSVERSINHQKATRATRATRNPTCSLKGAGRSRTSAALSATLGVTG